MPWREDNMDAMVTARMPQGKKEAGNTILSELGTNPSQFINDSYDYVIQTRQLPFKDKRVNRTQKEIQAAAAFTDSIPFPVAKRFVSMTDDEIRQERLIAQGLATRETFT